jgi:hypothetical protein
VVDTGVELLLIEDTLTVLTGTITIELKEEIMELVITITLMDTERELTQDTLTLHTEDT